MSQFPFPPAEFDKPWKRCKTCMRELPREEFKPNGDIDAAHVCQECRAVGANRQQRLIRQTKLDGESAIKNFIAKIREGAISTPHITELCAEMYKRFGGLEAFTVAYYQQIMKAQADRPGSKVVLDAYYSVVKLTLLSTEHRQSAPDAAEMDDEAIESEILKLAPRLLPAPQVIDGTLLEQTGFPTEASPVPASETKASDGEAA